MHIITCCSIVLLSFIIFTDLSVFYLILIFIAVSIFGYFVNSEIRKVVKEDTFDSNLEDPVIGSIKIWIESLMVGCKTGENISNMILKS